MLPEKSYWLSYVDFYVSVTFLLIANQAHITGEGSCTGDMDDLAALERLSLVARIAGELENHLGINDKTLAEFIMAEHAKAKNVEAFSKAMKDMADLPDSLIASINRQLDTKNSSTNGKTQAGNGVKQEDGKRSVFKGLAMADQDPAALDDTFAALEDLAVPSPAVRAPKRQYEHDHGSSKHRRKEHRSSSVKHEHRSRKDDYVFDHSEDISKSKSRYPRKDMPPPSNRVHATDANNLPLGRRGDPMSRPKLGHTDDFDFDKKKPLPPAKANLATADEWELAVLLRAGAIKHSDLPGYSEDTGPGRIDDAQEEEVEVEVIENHEPLFLRGQTSKALEMSPIRIVKAPEGSMVRTAMTSESAAKERRELKQQELRDQADKRRAEVDLSAQWNDPLAAPDQRKFASDIRNARQQHPNEPEPEWKKIIQNKEKSLGPPRKTMSMKQVRESLPIFPLRGQFIKAIKDNNLLILSGETGSGKSTQIPQYCAEAGLAEHGMIAVTQPRRVAAMSLAKRVAEETGSPLGQLCGYSIRFEDTCTPSTRIKYATEGVILREILTDPLLQQYSVIMIDEAHERSINTDVLLGLLKRTIKKRPDLKIIVSSATLNAELFQQYFDPEHPPPLFLVPGRTFPVEILHAREPVEDYFEAALDTVLEVHVTELDEQGGDILVFMTGKEEIESACEIIDRRAKALGSSSPMKLMVLPIFGVLPSDVASRIFEPTPPGTRKCIVATNIAETSLTIDGVKYVIDPGYAKLNSFDQGRRMNLLQVTPISQAAAKQRAGRAGRTGPGKCYRLYTEAQFLTDMTPETIPEIQRANLSSVALNLKAMGVNDMLAFPFISPPSVSSLLGALEELYNLGLLDDEGLLTRVGRRCADFPVDPMLAKMLIKSAELGCAEEILSVASCIEATQTIFYRPKEKTEQADKRKARFHDPTGDHLTYLNVWNAFKDSKFSQAWCNENFLVFRSLMKIGEVRKQLAEKMQQHRLPITSCGSNTDQVRKAITSAYFTNAVRKDQAEGNYKTHNDGTPVYLHPSSALFGKNAENVIYHGLISTTKDYMHVCTTIDVRWLVEFAPTFFKVAPTDRLSKRKKQERIQPLHNKYADDDSWRLSAQRRQGRGGGSTFG